MTTDKTPQGGADAAACDRLPIAVRAFAVAQSDRSVVQRPRRKLRGAPGSVSNWTLIFDAETTVDAAQRLRVGAYQLRKGDALDEAGLFYDPAALTDFEIAVLRQVCEAQGLALRNVSSFVEDVFYGRAYELRATIVGFNLPFDISRLASFKAGSARGKTMRGGFTFALSQFHWRPAIQIRHLNARASMIQFTHPPRIPNSRGQRRRGIEGRERRGSFVDLKTIAAALFSRSFSLALLADFLMTPNRKADSGGHGRKLTAGYVRYLLQDVQVSWECYQALRDKYALHALDGTPLPRLLSEASLGKGYLRQMGVRPFGEVQPEFPRHLTGAIMTAYYGGRAEVRWRREVKQVLYCDFKSMYPTVCTLMGLWRFVIAEGVTWSDSTTRIRELVETIDLEQLQRPEFWPLLTTLVRVRSRGDVFPVRAKYDGKSQTIGLNHLTSDILLWFTLADVIASKLLTGNSPEIIEAMTFAPNAPQRGLKPISIAGKANFRVDPAKEDFFKRLIDLRSEVLVELENSPDAMGEALNSEQQALKILANSTSYGIFVEMIVAEFDVAEQLSCYGHRGEGFSVRSKKVEEPGRYFHPLLATLITGAARLLLAVAETLCIRRGLDWAFCDTDSMAISRPGGMDQSEFLDRAKSVCEWFSPLNPYAKKGPLFKIEKANFALATQAGNSQFEPLHCLCISAKRYALFNIGPAGEIVIRKASAHGLGHLLAPYEAEDAPKSIPAPRENLETIGVERWQYDLWRSVIRAAMDGHPDEVDLSYHKALNHPAASRYGATTPALLAWFRQFNAGREFADQVKPFNFLISFQVRSKLELSEGEQLAIPARGRPRKQLPEKPVAPFDRNIAKAAKSAFDRETGKPVPVGQLMTYAEVLAQYHLRPEAKFRNGDFCDRGRTERRHVVAAKILHIGKESNKWEQQFFLGDDDDAEIEYGVEENANSLDGAFREFCERTGQRAAALELRISRTALRRTLATGTRAASRITRERIRRLVKIKG